MGEVDDDDPRPAPSAFRRVLSQILAFDRALDEAGDVEGSTHGGTPLDPGSSSDEATSIPERFGHYVVLGTLGRGGMGVVLEAFDKSLDRKVAVKLLHAHLAGRHTQRLVREAKALARLSHPHVVQVHEVGTVGEQTFVAMELVEGETLEHWQAVGRGWRECVEVYLQAGRGLAAAHAKDLVHRDFKPGNCILDREGRVRVLDFGLVRELDATDMEQELVEPSSPSLEDTELGPELTRTGTVLGTLAYMAPEQLQGAAVDARADQFSFCVSLYEVHPADP